MGWLKKQAKKLEKGVKTGAKSVGKAVTTGAKSVAGYIGDGVEAVADLVSDVVVSVGDVLMDSIKHIADFIEESVVNPLVDVLPPFFGEIVSKAFGAAVDVAYSMVLWSAAPVLAITNLLGANNSADLARYALGAAIVFTRAFELAPSWLTTTILVVVSFVCPPAGLVIAGVAIAALGLAKIAERKMKDLETEDLVDVLFWLDKFGLIDASPVREAMNQPPPQYEEPPSIEFVPQPPLLGEWLVELEVARQHARGINASRVITFTEVKYAMD